MTDAEGPGRRYVAAGVVASMLLAALFVVLDLGGLFPSLFAAVWLLLIPVLTLVQTPPPAGDLHLRRLGFYTTSILVLALAGLVAVLLAPGLAQQPGMWLSGPLSASKVLGPAALLTAAGVVIAYGFRALSGRFGWHETELVRAIIPVTGRERGVFALLSATAGISEEIVFRGFLPAFLLPWTGSYLAGALPVAVVFGFLHAYQGPHGIVRTAMMGMVLAAGVAWTGSLWPSIFAHGALDLLFGLVLGKSLLGEPGPGSPAEGATWT